MRFLIRRAATDRIGCSDAANAYMYGKMPAVELLNGIDLQRFEQARETGDRADDLKEAAVHLATVGRISMQKNPLFLCEIIKELSLLRQDFVLHWAGSGDLLDTVRETIRTLEIEPYVQMLGVRKDIPQILCACDCFLLPSLFEGLAIVLIEAQACGLTCFVSDNLSRQTDAGACRFLSLELDAKAWAKEIDETLRHPESRPIAVPERIAAYDIRNYTRKLEEIYSDSKKEI
jgi:glycosyltransferase involved in cell wall biosynthesis